MKFYQFLNVRGYIEEIPFKPEYYLKKTYLEHHDRMIDEKIYMEILHKLYTFPLTLRGPVPDVDNKQGAGNGCINRTVSDGL